MHRRRLRRASELFRSRLGRYLMAVVVAGWCWSCRSGERHAKPALRDTTRGTMVGSSPGATRAGINDYNRQREALGNLDSLVTPAQPAVPRN